MTSTLERPAAAPPPPTPPPERGERVVLLVVGVIMAVVASAFAAPWVEPGPADGSDLARFGRSTNGDAWREVNHGPDGAALSWAAGNTVVQPGFRALLNWRTAPRDALVAIADPGGSLADADADALGAVEAYENRNRTLRAESGVTEEVSYSVLTDDALLQIGFHDPATDSDLVFDPPLVLLQRDLTVGASWHGDGSVGGADYSWDREVTERGPASTSLGDFTDCILTQTDFAITRDGEQLLHNVTSERWCAGVGMVETTSHDPETGEVTSTTTVTATRDHTGADSSPAPPRSDPDTTPTGPGQPDAWTWTRHGRIRDAADATIPPTWVEAPSPLVLVAGQDHDLVAFPAHAVGEQPVWRFRTGGSVHSQPLHDPATGRIFFGSTDRRVYALDDRGMFLWAAATGDNVATRPALAGDVLVVGSEDRTIHGLDAGSGERLWTVATGGPVVSSPAVLGATAVIGSDDGAVRAIDVSTGRVRWEHHLDDPVTAPVATTGDDAVVVATTGGEIAILDAADGAVRWTATVSWPVRTAPLVTGGTIVVVDDGGTVTAWDATTGAERWGHEGRAVGAPAAVPDAGVAVATSDGRVELLDVGAGGLVRTWDAADARGATDAAPAFDHGPTMTPAGLWVVDAGTVLRQLAAPVAPDQEAEEDPEAASTDPDLAWLTIPNQPPWTEDDVPASTPLAFGDRILQPTVGGRFLALDPTTGEAELLGALDIGERGLFAEGAVVGDRLYVNVGPTLYAVDLPEVEVAWQFDGNPVAARPPVVVGDAVVWVNEPASGGDEPAVPVVSVVGAADGTLRWSAPLPNDATLSGPTVRDGTVFTNSGAFDLDTGTPLWTSPLEQPGTGSPGLSQDGGTLYVSLTAPEDAANGIAALDATTGAVLWRSQEPPVGLLPTGTPWSAGDVVVVPTIDGAVVGLDAATGAQRWRYTPPQPLLGTITVDAGLVWLATDNAAVLALDAATGEVRHRFDDLDQPVHHYALAQRPGRVGDRIVVAVGYAVVAFDVSTSP